MLGTLKREETRFNDNYRYASPADGYRYDGNGGTPSFDARSQGNRQYGEFASAASVMDEPVRQRPMNVDLSRQEALWQRLNQNTASMVNNNSSSYAPPRQEYRDHPAFTDSRQTEAAMTFEPMSLVSKPTPNALHAREKVMRKARKKRVSTQGKVILAVYFAVVLLIAALIIVNSEAVTGASDAGTPENVVTDVYEVNENGLAFIPSPYNSNADTNWFDEFCDKLSK